MSRASIDEEEPGYAVVALDPVNFEKPYTKKLAGVSTVHKSTLPDINGKVRLTRGYPAMTASVVNPQNPGHHLCQLVFLYH